MSLVDPDNRRPVDYKSRQDLLTTIASNHVSPTKADWLRDLDSGAINLRLIIRALGFRNAHCELFASGEYIPLQPEGAKKEHVCAFARRKETEIAVVLVPRLCCTLINRPLSPSRPLRLTTSPPCGSDVWLDTRILFPGQVDSSFLNVLTGERIATEKTANQNCLPLHKVFATFPVALLASESLMP